MKSSWDITPCVPWKVNRRFGGRCRLHLRGRRLSQARNQRGKQSSALKWRRLVPPKCRLIFKRLHGVISQKIELFMEMTCSSETSVDIQRTTRRYIPEDRTLHGDDVFLWNIGWHSADYMALYPRIQNSSRRITFCWGISQPLLGRQRTECGGNRKNMFMPFCE
jgi:hypothetical protein